MSTIIESIDAADDQPPLFGRSYAAFEQKSVEKVLPKYLNDKTFLISCPPNIDINYIPEEDRRYIMATKPLKKGDFIFANTSVTFNIDKVTSITLDTFGHVVHCPFLTHTVNRHDIGTYYFIGVKHVVILFFALIEYLNHFI